ncbi:SCO2524 family protein [Nocardia sp. NPDC051832]|uniref:SCO2524 family protein n=1 Tax=Nocardia sp. NPDC051832 TaxID=3155673 RepID=UPI003448AB26
MRIQPRQQILDIWRAMMATCWDGRQWSWDGIVDRNSISDTEQLLCLLYPATEIDNFALDNPGRIEGDVRVALEPLGYDEPIPSAIVSLLENYLRNNTRDDGQPDFSAGSYLESADPEREPTKVQRTIEVVDAYSMSLTLCSAGLRFLRAYDAAAKSTSTKRRIETLAAGLSARLTAAMAGLIRSFTVTAVAPKSPEGQAMIGMLNQTGRPERMVVADFTRTMDRVRARLRSGVDIGLDDATRDALDDEHMLFECGWSWGIIRGAAPVAFIEDAIAQEPGIANPRPSLYFTMTALDGINDLLSPRAGELALLDEKQHLLAQALRTRWELAQRYWSTIARFGSGSWPLEDIPWRTADGEQSDYFSLLVSAVLVQDLVARTASDDDLTRAVTIFDELAARGRIIRRPLRGDPAVALHTPGVRLPLKGSEAIDHGPELEWVASDFSAVLLKRVLQVAGLSNNVATRDKLMELAKFTMDHVVARSICSGAAKGLWDDLAGVFGPAEAERETRPSWYMTARIVECLVAAERTYRSSLPNWPELQSLALTLLNTAEHRYNQEMLNESADTMAYPLEHVEERIDQARKQIRDDAAATVVHALEALRELEKFATARRDAARSV